MTQSSTVRAASSLSVQARHGLRTPPLGVCAHRFVASADQALDA